MGKDMVDSLDIFVYTDRTSRFNGFVRGKNDPMRLKRAIKIIMRRDSLINALGKVVELAQIRVIVHISAIDQGDIKLVPSFHPVKNTGAELIVFHGAVASDDIHVEHVWLETIRYGGNLADHVGALELEERDGIGRIIIRLEDFIGFLSLQENTSSTSPWAR